MSTCAWSCACHGVHLEVKRKLSGASFALAASECHEDLAVLTLTVRAILLPSVALFKNGVTDVFFRPSLDILDTNFYGVWGLQIMSLIHPKVHFFIFCMIPSITQKFEILKP